MLAGEKTVIAFEKFYLLQLKLEIFLHFFTSLSFYSIPFFSGIALLQTLCAQKVHLKVAPPSALHKVSRHIPPIPLHKLLITDFNVWRFSPVPPLRRSIILTHPRRFPP